MRFENWSDFTDLACPSGSLEGKFKGTNYGDNHHEFWSKVWQQDPSDIYDGKLLNTITEPTPSNPNSTWIYGNWFCLTYGEKTILSKSYLKIKCIKMPCIWFKKYEQYNLI